MKRFACGLVVGKLAPLHLGHELLVHAALAQCERVIVLSYGKPEYAGCSAELRRAWLKARLPNVEAHVLEHDLPDDAAPGAVQRAFVARLCRERLKVQPDAVFTSEAYGDGFAAHLAVAFDKRVEHVCVDAARAQVPISSSQIRADVDAARAFLGPEVYASFVRRVAIVGGESTGKSTLATELARAFGTVSVAEYGRELWTQKGGALVLDDMLHIARTQVAREEAACLHAYRFVFCDTTPLTTLLYSEDMFGRSDPELGLLSQRPYALTVLAAPDFPFVQDGTRQDARYRERQHARYQERLALYGVPFVLATGSLAQRRAQIAQQIAPLRRLELGAQRT